MTPLGRDGWTKEDRGQRSEVGGQKYWNAGIKDNVGKSEDRDRRSEVRCLMSDDRGQSADYVDCQDLGI